MKRLFTYILALSLLPQITSAAVVVGKTEGTFAVSPKGAATYTIPLTIQKGMSDFKPELSLVYDSQDGSGIMGLGWSIKGMHTISTVLKCQYFDGNNLAGAAYALDGMRLIETISPNGQLYYRTEHDKGDSISITSSQNGAPVAFEVKSMDGCTYRYGSTTGRYPLSGTASQWAIDYAQDALGNYISYTYDQNGGLYPTSITYGSNIHGTAGVNCVISFTYDSSAPKRLTKIECKYNGNIYRSYTFEYANSPSRLTSITEGGRNSATFNATSFTWAQNRISSITDGLGATESYSYGTYNITNGNSIYRITSRTETISTDSRTTTYTYTNPVNYTDGKGFLGFKKIEAVTKSNGLEIYKTETEYRLDADHRVLSQNSIKKMTPHGSDITQHFTETFIEDAGNADDKVYRTSAYDYRQYLDFEANDYRNEYTYNNGILSEHIYTDDGLVITDNITCWKSPISNVRIKGLPCVKQTVKEFYDFYEGVEQDPIYEVTTYERDPHTGLVLKETKKRLSDEGDTCTISMDGYSYNEYGQVTRHWTIAFNDEEGGDTLVTTYEYDTYGRLKKEYNPLGQSKTYYYNTYTGALSTVYDFNRATTSYTYDNMGRETRCTSPSKVITTSRSTDNYGGSVYRVYVTETGKMPVGTYYDAWGRKVAESRTLPKNSVMYTDYRYNSFGEIDFVSFPHAKAESCSEGTNYTYDSYDHYLIKTEDTNGKICTWNHIYRSYCIESCIDGVSETIDSLGLGSGRILYVTHGNEGNTGYSYDADLKIRKITNETNSGNKVTVFEYNNYGRLSRTIDMNNVTTQYEYDKNGYPKRTIVDGNIVETNYDKYGRLMSKSWTGPDGESHTVNYTYNTAINKKHLVSKEQGDNYTYTYTYDTYGKLTRKVHNVTSSRGSESISINYEYNSDKLISKKNFSTGVTELFGYKNGVLVADTLGGFPAMSLTKQDRWGNPTEEKLFFGTTTRLFDDYGHMLSMKHTGYTPQNYAISDSCEYDLQTGNMIAKNAITHTYNGDNRLTGWGSHTYSYDDKGNITHQPSVGDFTYNAYRLNDMAEASGFHTDDSLSISYYQALGRPKSIKNDNYMAEFSYDGDGNRILMEVYKKVQGQFRFLFRRFYLGTNVEITLDSLSNKTTFYYAGGNPETAPAVLSTERRGRSTSTTNFYQIYRDNAGNALLYEDRNTGHWFFTYSPWGVMTHSNNGTLYMPNQLGDNQVYRTYKGFENLWMFGLLLDKTRLYDPYIGRYLSPDTNYSVTGGPLDHNPYVFSKNNPFKKF